MKKFVWILILFLVSIQVEAKEEPKELYAQSAVLMDADTGRILFEKDGNSVKAMASTTKIMTCILALENASPDSVVAFSKNASAKPKVHLAASEGEQFYMNDLLYSLMLESHNDTATAIAENIAGSEEAFAIRMNEKAKELGCDNTYFITPNGLDAQDDHGMHSTTAIDLARILRYCIAESPKKEEFLEIMRTREYSFSNLARTKNYYCANGNAYLSMNPDAICGKTGYTAMAGYCYVGAVENEGRTFIVSLLASGWPNHKDYKWKDMNRIMEYAMSSYQLVPIEKEIHLPRILVKNGMTDQLFEESYISVQMDGVEKCILLSDEEKLDAAYYQPKEIEAPILQGEQVGSVKYSLNDVFVGEYPIRSIQTVKRIDFFWIFSKIMKMYLI